MRSGSAVRKKIKTFGAHFQQWYDTFRRPNIQARQHANYQRCIDKIPKTVTEKQASQVVSQELQNHLNSLKSSKYRYWTKILLVAFFETAEIDGVVKKNVAKGLIADQPVAAERQTLSREDEPKFMELMPEIYRDHTKAYIYTGCRLSELFKIDECDVDRQKRIINVKETKNLTRAERKVMSYKIRVTPLLPEIVNMQFPLPKISISRFHERFRNACKQLGIKVTPHDMRHTFASRCDEQGIDIKVIQLALGHADERMTRHYIHKSAKTKEKMVSDAFAKMQNSTPVSTPLRSEKCTKDPE